MGKRASGVLLLLPLSLVLAGCVVSKSSNGDNKENVSVKTPLGGVEVKTDKLAPADVGLPEYPGAVRVRDKEHGDADIDLSFGKFQMRVKAMEYETPDSPDKVRQFYEKAMARFGDVLSCKNKQPTGKLTRTREGLTCSDQESHGHLSADISDDGGKTELKAGSRMHQHIVGIEPKGDGTKFGLVSLDLPASVNQETN